MAERLGLVDLTGDAERARMLVAERFPSADVEVVDKARLRSGSPIAAGR